MPELKFYYAPGACSLAPHILLHTSGLPFHAIPLRVSAIRTDFPPSFSLINPKMKVPVLALDAEVITEIPAIATAISNLVPERHFMGRTGLEAVRVYEWINWLSGTLHGAGFGHVFRPQRWSVQGDGLEGIREQGLVVVKECFDMIEGKLAG
ncbi:Glutathione S-transferase, partial [Lachnellula subtilissima]